jgi:Na+/H+ antiporter NhaA
MSNPEADTTPTPVATRTAWARNLQTPIRLFLRTETSSAAALLAATAAALVWANVGGSSYDTVWGTTFSLRLGSWVLSEDLRHWINTGLMTFFFFVVGLEARREFDMGELRERRRVTIPALTGLGGMAVAVGVFLLFNAGRPTAGGWGVAMSTDTAFALAVLAMVGPRFPERLRAFMLTVVVIDDVVSLVVIATVYSTDIHTTALIAALSILAALLVVGATRVRYGLVYAALGGAAWIALFSAGVDPVVIGLVMGLMTTAYPAAREDLSRASDVFRRFREQPTPELEFTARSALAAAISPNEHLQRLYHPWTSYVIVPLFALANAGIAIDGGLLGRAFTSALTLGILVGYVAGKPAGVLATSWLVTKLSGGRLRPPVGWLAVGGAGAAAGIGFTVSLLIADLAFTGQALEEAKLGILSGALCASVATWTVFRVAAALPKPRRARALLGTAELIVDLAAPVDDERDHIRGPKHAPVTVLEYGDFECPFCGRAEPALRDLLREAGDVRYVWRHLPLNDVHPRAQRAAEAAEAAAEQGAFWPMHDLLFEHQDELRPPDLVRYARELGLDVDRFTEDLRRHTGDGRIAEDVDGADLSGVSGTPSFFINGRRHNGAYDLAALEDAVRLARVRVSIAA